MGIAVQELLANDFFRDFEVVAGRKGINKEIQGITTILRALTPRKNFC